jgi:GAF domain-containing protein
MTSVDPALATPPTGVPATSPTDRTPFQRLLAVALDLAGTLDSREIEAKTLRAAIDLVAADTVSFWVPHGGGLACPVAVGDHATALLGKRFDPRQLDAVLPAEDGMVVMHASLASAGGEPGALRVARDPAASGVFSDTDRELLTGLAAASGIALQNAKRAISNDRADDLALVMEMSREIGSTLDLDRVMQSVVNLAMRALPFDRGAIALYERGTCDIRAVAGAEKVDPDDPELKDLAVRAAWAAGVGESFYLSDRSDPGSDAERLFLQIFSEDLAQDGVTSGLYMPLKDEEGVVGILVLESATAEFATARQRELIGILANQATVALRNAQLYHQVPLADALGALQARKQALLALPRHRRIGVAAVVLLTVSALTLIRWPLRVDAIAPAFRPTARAEIRPLTDGVIERVMVREGPVVRDAELRADLGAATAAAVAAERSAANAASRGDAAEERLQRLRSEVLRREAAVLDEQVRATTIRAPLAGVVLTARPEERVGAWAEAGSALLVVGRTDTLELDFMVDQRDIGRVRVGDVLRLRVAAYPQRTFTGRVTGIADVGADSAGVVAFPVRAVVPNADGALRPGMVAYARVLTAPASVFGRATREPMRQLRLLWWRMWS